MIWIYLKQVSFYPSDLDEKLPTNGLKKTLPGTIRDIWLQLEGHSDHKSFHKLLEK